VVAAHAGQLGTPQSVWVALEARRGELYAAQYDATVLEQPKLVEPFHLLNEVERANDERNARLFRMDWSQPGKSEGVAFPPKADFLARLAAHRTNFIAGHELAPVYLRHVEFVKALPPKFGVL
jgi:tRNA A37 threonylcarbamoyladenosine modification protein TsaB